MSEPINEVLNFRQRGYQNSGTKVVVEVFGNDPAPVAKDGSTYTLLWDHDVTTTTTVSQHVNVQ